jgi:bifunctional non-homologous end joining protein LigD
VPAANGSTDFSVLQNELKGRSTKIVLVAFDLLYLNGYDLRKLRLIERKALLKKILAETDVQFSESFEVDGREMFKHACEIGLEGVVSKVRDSRYLSGRRNDWVKKTCAQRETLPIAGFALKENKFDGIYVGRQHARILGLTYVRPDPDQPRRPARKASRKPSPSSSPTVQGRRKKGRRHLCDLSLSDLSVA